MKSLSSKISSFLLKLPCINDFRFTYIQVEVEKHKGLYLGTLRMETSGDIFVDFSTQQLGKLCESFANIKICNLKSVVCLIREPRQAYIMLWFLLSDSWVFSSYFYIFFSFSLVYNCILPKHFFGLTCLFVCRDVYKNNALVLRTEEQSYSERWGE